MKRHTPVGLIDVLLAGAASGHLYRRISWDPLFCRSCVKSNGADSHERGAT